MFEILKKKENYLWLNPISFFFSYIYFFFPQRWQNDTMPSKCWKLVENWSFGYRLWLRTNNIPSFCCCPPAMSPTLILFPIILYFPLLITHLSLHLLFFLSFFSTCSLYMMCMSAALKEQLFIALAAHVLLNSIWYCLVLTTPDYFELLVCPFHLCINFVNRWQPQSDLLHIFFCCIKKQKLNKRKPNWNM